MSPKRYQGATNEILIESEHFIVEKNVEHVESCCIVYLTNFAGKMIGKHKSIVVVKRFRAQKQLILYVRHLIFYKVTFGYIGLGNMAFEVVKLGHFIS